MLTTLAPLWLFMLLPVWIPLIAVRLGAVGDRLAALGGRTPAPSVHGRIRQRRHLEHQHEGRRLAPVAAS